MKMKQEHFTYLSAAIKPLDTQERRTLSTQFGFPDKRYRWDLAFAAAGVSKWICDNLYPYLNDEHIDTALRQIVPPL